MSFRSSSGATIRLQQLAGSGPGSPTGKGYTGHRRKSSSPDNHPIVAAHFRGGHLQSSNWAHVCRRSRRPIGVAVTAKSWLLFPPGCGIPRPAWKPSVTREPIRLRNEENSFPVDPIVRAQFQPRIGLCLCSGLHGTAKVIESPAQRPQRSGCGLCWSPWACPRRHCSQ